MARVIDLVRQYGVVRATRRIAKRLLLPVIRSENYVLLAIKTPDIDAATLPASSERMTVIRVEHVETWRDTGAITAGTAGVFRGYLAAGLTGLAAQVGDTVAGYCWIHPPGLYAVTDGLRFAIQPGEYASVNLFVAPQFRSRGLGSELNRETMRQVPRALLFIFILRENERAIQNWVRLGARPVARCALTEWRLIRRAPRVQIESPDSSIPGIADRFRVSPLER